MNATRHILEFALARHQLPGPARAAALHLLGDSLAVGAAGASAPGAAGVLQAARGWGAGGEARILARGTRLPAAGAAFVNGFQIHCLEWDAVHEQAVVHALSTVTAALGAAIDRQGGCDPEEALTALAVGVDIASGLGLAAKSGLRFFRPSTAGCIGAALAVARIERTDALADVLGLAYSQCAGTMQAHVEGSIALPLQIAVAARAAITANDLVRAGLTGPHDALEGPFGYFRLFDEGDLTEYAHGLGRIWRIGEVSVKPFPCGRASHAALATLQAMRREEALEAERVRRIDIHSPPLIGRLVGRPLHPAMSPATARLCLPLLSALMLTSGRIDPRRFEPATFADPRIRALAAKVHVSTDDNPDPNALSPQRLVVHLTEGTVLERVIATTLGHPGAPMSAAQTAAKRDLAFELAGALADPRLRADPLSYFTLPGTA
ncbi:MAG TPA: MmgE/PrpD family protein [Steroidobacteraceae bacterium]